MEQINSLTIQKDRWRVKERQLTEENETLKRSTQEKVSLLEKELKEKEEIIVRTKK